MKLVVLGILFLAISEAFSLECNAPSVKEQIMHAKDIFVGKINRIVSVEKLVFSDWPYDAEEKISVELKVLDVLKGSNRRLQIVDFSYEPSIGEKYLIFDNSAFSSSCDISLSKRVENAQELLKLLDYKSEPNESKQVTWQVSSSTDHEMKVVAVGLSRVIQVQPGFSLVVANEGYTATDFGAVNRLFLVYHSKSEIPHYEAAFFLGNIHSVNSVKSLDASLLQINTLLHDSLWKASEVRLLVDLSELNKVMEAPPKKEGSLDVSVKVTATEIQKFENPNKEFHRTIR